MSPLGSPFLASFLAFLAALACSRVMIWLAPPLGYLDRPSPRKLHASPTPLLGGLAVALALATSLCLSITGHAAPACGIPACHTPFLAAALAMLAIGLYDDRSALAPLPKFAALCAASAVPALLMLFAGAAVIDALACAAALLFFSNAFNLLDNSDGQCASVSAAALAAAALHGAPAPRLAAAGAFLGFLWWNRPPARIFLGDAGSLLAGVCCVWLVLRDPSLPSFHLNPLLLPALWIPLYDTLSVIAIRLSQRRPIWQGGQDHFAWRIMRRGVSPAATDALLAAATFLPACLTLFLPRSAGWFFTPALLLTAAACELSSSPPRRTTC